MDRKYPRNAPCSCGSGMKWKHCCGRTKVHFQQRSPWCVVDLTSVKATLGGSDAAVAIRKQVEDRLLSDPDLAHLWALMRALGQPATYSIESFAFNVQCVEEDARAGRLALPTSEPEWVAALVAEYKANVESFASPEAESGESAHGTPKEVPMKVHRMLNHLAESEIGVAFLDDLLAKLRSQMEAGYRLAFPVFPRRNGRVLQCIALLTAASDRRLEAMRHLKVTPDATHVFIFLAFASENDWLRQARQITALYPEQPNAPELIVG